MTTTISVPGITLQDSPKIFLAAVPGKWLLTRTTPSWRIQDPEAGFQRLVREQRAREIALAVLDQQRTFPNAIVLATDDNSFTLNGESLLIPSKARFLVVDGQHRLWAQRFSKYEATYACVIHMGLNEVAMARLFLEINDNQKRVPSSLRWDLVRLVRPDDDPYAIAAAEIVYLLATDQESPLFQRIDLTGEQPEIQLKQGSLAPDIKPLLTRKSPLFDLSFDQQYSLIVQYLIAIKNVDRDGWINASSVFYRARVLRALLRLLPELIRSKRTPAVNLSFEDFVPYLERISTATLETEQIRAVQGSAGIKAIYEQMLDQIFDKGSI